MDSERTTSIIAGYTLFACLISLGVQTTTLAVPVSPSDPTWAWNFDDGAGTILSATYGNVDGTLDGGANTQWSTDTPFAYSGNGSLDFSGGISNNSQVLLDDGAGSDVINISGGGNNAFTVSLWAKNDDLTGSANRASLFGNWFTGTGQNILIQTPDSVADELNANVRMAGDVTNTLSGTVASGGWEHYVFVYNGSAGSTGTAELFINGVSVATSTSADVLENYVSEGEYRIGGDSRGNNLSKGRDYMFDGLIDEVAIWKSALSDDEVAWLNANSFNQLVPEPASVSLMGLAGALILWRRR